MSTTPSAAPKVAVVTGAARGIGAAIAARLARDGFAVAVLDLDEAACARTVETVEKEGGRALAVGCDVSDAQQVEAGVARVAAELGAPTVLVNNAGIIRDNLVHKMTDQDFDSVIGVHLRGAFLMARAVQRHQTAAGWGRTVNLSSSAALGNRGQSNYSSAKAGLLGLTKTLAIELGPFGVTVNCVAPGFIATEMTEATAERMGITFEEFTDRYAKAIPVRRGGRPEDIAQAVSFFVREEAGFVNGQILYVAGGPKG
ncbi:3-oxoacyl-ACP reductase FabG [Streptomyces zaomyceticus]|uniref:3-oxoacyl-ACP reductase FabG n=1 Tax=Streptomyces zaomyceticus TaxID=68286 RepID=UPI00167A2D20|nr:3-oxoacyl-ACP reductase FabG [Streptomyces zaomyceticus]GHG42670.1 3-oxoacyl-ACP reductase [Streptomyces zaomyceticus]